MKRWVVGITREAVKQLVAIADQRVQQSIRQRIDRLAYEPDKQGKPMKDELKGYRSVRAIGQRYRIIYKVDDERVTVLSPLRANSLKGGSILSSFQDILEAEEESSTKKEESNHDSHADETRTDSGTCHRR